mmetsp:Transcript_31388/g.82324  ORF Transcript_31388/g.82324 Transcript_31388/m.82324 type:complete len:111 (+) Transcript_31388:18-350(+)
MVSSDDYETSLGAFWACWLDTFVRSARTPTRGDTIADTYARAEEAYWSKNTSLLEHNKMVCGAGPRKDPLTFGTVSCSEGDRVGAEPLWGLLHGSDRLPEQQLKGPESSL